MKTLIIDGGGTKTVGYLIENKKIIKEFKTGPSNVNSNYEISLQNILKTIKEFNNNFDQIKIGVAGVWQNSENISKLKNDILLKVNSPIEITNDLEMIAKICVPNNEKALLINLGTGSAAIESQNGKYNMHLGWGKVINDLGSGYDIGINLLKFLSRCEDTNSISKIYIKFLSDFQISSIRDYVSKCNCWTNVSNLAEWVAKLGHVGNELFIIPRVKELLDYLSYINVDSIYLNGSIFLKNLAVQDLVKRYYKNKKIEIIDYRSSIIKSSYF